MCDFPETSPRSGTQCGGAGRRFAEPRTAGATVGRSGTVSW